MAGTWEGYRKPERREGMLTMIAKQDAKPREGPCTECTQRSPKGRGQCPQIEET